MRTPVLFAILLVVGGTATSIGKAFFLPSDAYTKQARLLTAYRLHPDATLKRINAAYLACADSKYAEGPAANDIRHLAALLMLEAISQRVADADDVSGKKRALQLMQTHLPGIKAKLPVSRGEDQFLLYLQALREDGVPTCVISSSA
ncbi:hypothetical protein RMR10_020465 [Agrobacterium rosae]|uniref:hypothetical protein n=1 Tax=Agrobacterium rosae TaxID=1972867 RepID=UPI002A0DAB3B|nr:hypothetical protein [Agrobacterium rosae]MDX8313960.1 hypothetical protein [Agrobacterium rosae]